MWYFGLQLSLSQLPNNESVYISKQAQSKRLQMDYTKTNEIKNANQSYLQLTDTHNLARFNILHRDKKKKPHKLITEANTLSPCLCVSLQFDLTALLLCFLGHGYFQQTKNWVKEKKSCCEYSMRIVNEKTNKTNILPNGSEKLNRRQICSAVLKTPCCYFSFFL